MNPLYVIYGDEAHRLTTELLEQIKPETVLEKDAKILLKPNLVVAKSWQSGATTNPEIARAVIAYFRDKGFNNLTIAEGAWIGYDTVRAFKACGYSELSDKTGVPLLDTKRDTMVKTSHKGYTFEIAQSALDADLIVNLPVIKGHCQTKLTCALKNMKGVISDGEKRRFHGLGLHTPITYLNTFFKHMLTIADGIYGDIDFEEGGNPVKMDTMLASFDPVLLDAYAATLLGYTPEEIGYIKIADDEGLGNMAVTDKNTVILNEPTITESYAHTARVTRLKRYIDERSACSACVGNLLRALHGMENSGDLNRLSDKISVGQAFKNLSPALGIGRCACKDGTCMGCPPSASEITAYIKSKI